METPNWRQLLVGLLAATMLGLIGFFGKFRDRGTGTPIQKVVPLSAEKKIPAAPSAKVEQEANVPIEPKRLVIDIGGAVSKPGVYWVEDGARLQELVTLAGGLLADADRERVNLALALKDGQKIMIPWQRVATEATQPVIRDSQAPLQPNEPEVPHPTEPAPISPININRASAVDFENLPGVGSTIARRIVDYRDRVGEFKSIEELGQVRGVGDKLLEKIRPYLSL